MSDSAAQARPARRAGGRARLGYGVLALAVIAAGVFALWYRSYYNIWPAQDATARVHWCERDYQATGNAPETWSQVNRGAPVHAFGSYPPLGVPRQRLYAALTPGAAPGGCATAVYLRTGPDRYQSYSLLGGD
jgi:hypothetical protein